MIIKESQPKREQEFLPSARSTFISKYGDVAYRYKNFPDELSTMAEAQTEESSRTSGSIRFSSHTWKIDIVYIKSL